MNAATIGASSAGVSAATAGRRKSSRWSSAWTRVPRSSARAAPFGHRGGLRGRRQRRQPEHPLDVEPVPAALVLRQPRVTQGPDERPPPLSHRPELRRGRRPTRTWSGFLLIYDRSLLHVVADERQPDPGIRRQLGLADARGDVRDEGGHDPVDRRRPVALLPRVHPRSAAQDQPFLCPRHRDVEQPALLGLVGRDLLEPERFVVERRNLRTRPGPAQPQPDPRHRRRPARAVPGRRRRGRGRRRTRTGTRAPWRGGSSSAGRRDRFALDRRLALAAAAPAPIRAMKPCRSVPATPPIRAPAASACGRWPAGAGRRAAPAPPARSRSVRAPGRAASRSPTGAPRAARPRTTSRTPRAGPGPRRRARRPPAPRTGRGRRASARRAGRRGRQIGLLVTRVGERPQVGGELTTCGCAQYPARRSHMSEPRPPRARARTPPGRSSPGSERRRRPR